MLLLQSLGYINNLLGQFVLKKIDNVAAEQFTSITQKAWYNLILLSQSDVFGSCNQSILMNLCTALKFQKAERTVFYTVGCMPILFAAASIYLYWNSAWLNPDHDWILMVYSQKEDHNIVIMLNCTAAFINMWIIHVPLHVKYLVEYKSLHFCNVDLCRTLFIIKNYMIYILGTSPICDLNETHLFSCVEFPLMESSFDERWKGSQYNVNLIQFIIPWRAILFVSRLSSIYILINVQECGQRGSLFIRI